MWVDSHGETGPETMKNRRGEEEEGGRMTHTAAQRKKIVPPFWTLIPLSPVTSEVTSATSTGFPADVWSNG